MGLINLVLKTVILILDLRDTYDALDAVKLEEIGCSERQVLVRNPQDGTKQLTTRKRVGTSKRKAAVRSALTTVLVWNLFNKLEPLCDRTVAWFVPFYDSIKTLLLIWMLFTRSYGASIVIFRLLAPMIRPYESIIDGIFAFIQQRFVWLAALMAPATHKCVGIWRALRTTIMAPHPSPSVVPASSGHNEAPRRKTSASSIGGKARKKPPPPSPPPASVKSSPASAVTSQANSIPKSQSSVVTAKPRQAPLKKVSNSNLAATRRVLQELPVPRHAFTSSPSEAGLSAPSTASRADQPATDRAAPIVSSPVVKTEPSEASLPPPTSAMGPPPTPPTSLQNYAFIPGITPQRSGPASLISPTPRFPGGFSFSIAAGQASASTGANPFQSQARVPLTTQMAPLSLSSQQAGPSGATYLLGSQNSAKNSVTTHESVASANDDRIVPPPNGSSTLRKVSSSRSLKGKPASSTLHNGSKSLVSSNGKKRARADDAADGEGDGAGKLASKPTSPRKRVKAANGQGATNKTAAGSATAKARVKKPTSSNGHTAAPRRRVAANGTTSPARKVAAPVRKGTASKTAYEEAPTSSAPRSPEKKATAPATKPTAASTKATAQRTAVKKAATASKSRSQSTEAIEVSDPPQRLTRSRTKQNLTD